MTAPERTTAPVDAESQRRLRENDLEYRLVDMDDPSDGAAFLRADARGFLDEEPTDAHLAQMRETMRLRRNIGVFDDAAGAWPVATVNSWVTPLTVPGGEVDMWAISSVTVAGTHRRRGIARNLLEGELRAAKAAGVPIAGLTASEATIYSRYGFGPAVPVMRFTVDTARAGWAGAPSTGGRIAYADRPTIAADLEHLHEASRGARAGQVPGWRGRWTRMAGLAANDKEAAAVRGVRFTDADGAVQGAMAYTLAEQPEEFRSEMRIRSIITTSDEALRAIWGFVVQHDLVTSARVDLRPIDDPLPWLVADQRAVKAEVHDHGWLRVLDVETSLTARTYSAPFDLVLRVDDPLGFAGGDWRVTVSDGGRCAVTPSTDAPDLTMGVVELSAIYAGGVPAHQLAAAGRIQGDAVAVGALSRAFLTRPSPLLGIWY